MDATRPIDAQRRDAHANEDAGARPRGPASPLASAGALLADEQAGRVSDRLHDWRDTYEVRTKDERRTYEQLVVHSVRVDACRAREIALRAYESARARETWDDDRAVEAAELAAGLSRRPERVARRLATTAAGVRWLLARWEALGRVEAWGEGEESAAFDLLGVAAELRHGTPWASHGSPAALVESERARLSERLERSLLALDAMERSYAEQGLPIRMSAEMRRLQREEAACLRRYEEARRRLTPRVHAPAPAPAAPPTPAPPEPRRFESPPPPPRAEDPLPIAATPPAPAVQSSSQPRPNRRARRAALRAARAGRS